MQQTPGPHDDGQLYDPYIPMQSLSAPRPQFSMRNSYASADSYSMGGIGEDGMRTPPAGSTQHVPLMPQSYYDDPYAVGPDAVDRTVPPPLKYYPGGDQRPPWYKRRGVIILLLLALLAVVVGVGLAVYFLAIKPNQDDKKDGKSDDSKPGKNDDKGNNTTTPVNDDPATRTAFIGTNGAVVTMANGQTFEYKNTFGGYFVDASNTTNPYNDGARAQSFTPALNETWDYAKNIIRGVNIGGWLVLEPFITPAFYEKYRDIPGFNSAEWDISTAMRADTSPGGGIEQIENHYETFITEQDFAEIAGAGLNWVRLPIPYWVVEVYDGEPFVPKKAWTYVLKAFEWARKYGLRVNLDLHTVPGSQNGWNHSGKLGPTNWMRGPMGVANAQRSLDYMRIIVQFISQPEYTNVVPMFGIVNEPQVAADNLRQFTLEAYNVIRGVTGVGKGPVISIFDDFHTGDWVGFLPGADRIALDTHRYFAFDQQNKPSIDGFVNRPCTDWGNLLNGLRKNFGITAGGEFSLGYNDCGQFLVGGVQDIHHTTNCDFWDNWEEYTPALKAQLLDFALSSMDGMRDFFFWTWKISPNQAGKIRAPLWSYKLGLEQGWIPADPSKAVGHCVAQGVPFNAFTGPYPASATAGAGAPTSVQTGGVLAWPPANLPLAGAVLPTYTATGAIVTLPGPTPTPGSVATVTVGGWAFPQDTQAMAVPVAGCTYPNGWIQPDQMVATAC